MLNCRPVDATVPEKQSRLLSRSLSVFEQKKIEKALQAQQRSILEGTPQRIAGRVHSGPSFRCCPAEVAFNGFEAGAVYTQNVEVTNVSLGFSTFRVLPLADDVEGIISVIFEAPGRISAGRSARLTVVFAPQKEEDLSTEVILLSPTGPQSLPVICSRKRSALSFRPHRQSPEELLKLLHKSPTSAKGVRVAASEILTREKSKIMKNALSRSDKYRETGGERGPEEEAPTDGVVYLPAGHIQLGEVAAVRFRLSNTGSLGTAYRLFPVTPEELQEHLEPESPSSQQSEQPNETTNSVQDLAELPARNQNTEETATLNSVDAQPTEIQEKDSIFGQAEEDTRSFNASGWLEALQGEAVVLAQRLRISDKHNTFAWAKIVSSGLSKLLGKKKEQASREASCPETTFQLSLRSTLVKNAAGELDALQTQEITIVHAPTRTGRFVGFFALQFSNKEVLFHLRIA